MVIAADSNTRTKPLLDNLVYCRVNTYKQSEQTFDRIDSLNDRTKTRNV